MDEFKTIKAGDGISLEIVDDQHAEEIFNLVNANRIHLREWLPWVDNMHSVEFIESFIIDSKKSSLEGTDFAFVITIDGIIAGRIGIYKIDGQNKIGSIGYWLGSGFQGKGIITKACKALINYGFSNLGLNRLEIRCGIENYNSKAVPERLNFKQEGIIRQGELVGDIFIDLYLFAITKDEWKY